MIKIKKILMIVDSMLFAFIFLTAFSFALSVVLWLVGILGVTIWAVAKTLCVLVINVMLSLLIEELMDKLKRNEEI